MKEAAHNDGRWTALVGLVLVLTLAILVSPATAKKKNAIAKYRANAVVMSGVGNTQPTQFNADIYGWNTDEERSEILAAVKEATNDKYAGQAVSKALRKQPKMGTLWMTGTIGYPIRYARKIESGGKTQIILGTDRPVQASEVYAGSPSQDFAVTVVILNLPQDGKKGDGILSVGTELRWDEGSEKVEPTNITSQPIKLTDVHSMMK